MLIDEETLKVVEMGFLEEKEMLSYISNLQNRFGTENRYKLAVETIQFLGGTAGATVFKTCILVGRMLERAEMADFYEDIMEIYRKDEKMNLCGTMRTNDKGIKDVLIDRFAKDVPNMGKGNKKSPGWFFGFRADIWQAYAIGVTYYDLYILRRRYSQ